MARRGVWIRKRSLHDEDNPILEHASLTPAERIDLAWQLTLQAWLIQGKGDAASRLSRDTLRVLKRRG